MVKKPNTASFIPSQSQSEAIQDAIQTTKEGVNIRLQVKPNARASQVVEIGDLVSIQIAAPPRDGEANKEVLVFLAEVLGARKTDISLIAGHKSREKTVRIGGSQLTEEQIRSKLKANMS
ncbi:uncharacterized protein VTP21DRAFT_940 [Calcarisporiella thermophila]|uniref:uncharacterized protein n=1 Tax=Calcarisporiella thermophila TaxID=911321 RepID=UPI003743413B